MALPRLAEAAYPLYTFAYLLGDEDPWTRWVGQSAMLTTAVEVINLIQYYRHIQTCPSCAARGQLRDFIAERTVRGTR